MDEIIDELRRTRMSVDEEVWDNIRVKLNERNPHRFSDGLGWAFGDITRFLHGYILPKLNAKLFDLTNNIQEQNGLEVIRKINDEMDKIPENAKT